MLMCGLLAAAGSPVPEKSDGDRYLFVVETSAAMAKLEHGGRQAVFDLIYSGIEGRMRPGDSFAIWTFQEDVSIGEFPMHVWKPDDKLSLASRAGNYLKQVPYKDKASLSKALVRVMSLIRGVKDVNVIIVCSTAAKVEELGSFPLWDQRKGEAKKAKKPLLLTLAARGGSIVQRGVVLQGNELPLPHPPPELVTVELPPPAPLEVAPKVARAPIIIQAPPKPTPPPVETPALAQTNKTFVAQILPETNNAATTVTAVIPPTTLAGGESHAKAPENVSSLLPGPIPVAAREKAASDVSRTVPTTIATVAYTRERRLNPTALMLAGAGLLAVGLTVGAWLLISSRRGPELSSISQSMNRVRLTR